MQRVGGIQGYRLRVSKSAPLGGIRLRTENLLVSSAERYKNRSTVSRTTRIRPPPRRHEEISTRRGRSKA
jgi:hypothetical protein